MAALLQLLDERAQGFPGAVRTTTVRVDQRPEVEHHSPRPTRPPHLLESCATLLDRLLRGIPITPIELRPGEHAEPFSAPTFFASVSVPLILEPVARPGRVELIHAGEPDERDTVPLHLRARAILEPQCAFEKI